MWGYKTAKEKRLEKERDEQVRVITCGIRGARIIMGPRRRDEGEEDGTITCC